MMGRKLGILATLLVSLVSSTTGCESYYQQYRLKSAKVLIESRDFASAVKQMERLVKRYPDSEVAQEAARIGARTSRFDLKDYSQAIEFYRYLVIHSDSSVERIQAQRGIADIYFENLSDFEHAIAEYNKLLSLPLEDGDRYQYKFNVAKSYSQLNMFDQSKSEVEELLARASNPEQTYELLMFKSNLLNSAKLPREAIAVYRQLIEGYPDRARADNIALSLAVSLEEVGEFKAAIDSLESIKAIYPDPEFIELRIVRLKERMRNMPGARGLKK